MTDRPIIFSGPMVLAILEGRKTQTRRVIKPQPVFSGEGCCWYPENSANSLHYGSEEHFRKGWPTDFARFSPGDRLWVREAWRAITELDDMAPRDMPKAEKLSICYDADPCLVPSRWGRYRAAMHMSRWASRIALIVSEVRVQRLQDISEEDARAEGATPRQGFDKSYQQGFADLWDGINAKRDGGAFSCEVNPWIAAITFKACLRNIDTLVVVE